MMWPIVFRFILGWLINIILGILIFTVGMIAGVYLLDKIFTLYDHLIWLHNLKIYENYYCRFKIHP